MQRLWIVLLLTSCAGSSPPDPAPAPAPDPAPAADEAALERTEAAARTLGKTLKTRVVEAMGEGGPAGALAVCHTEAGELTRGVAADTEVAVGRSSLRLRNPDNAGPPWVTEWLLAQGEREAAGVEPLREVVATDQGREAHVILPIAVEPPCLACHGAPEQIPDEVESALAEAYPRDAATGYTAGALRGALWASAPVGTGE